MGNIVGKYGGLVSVFLGGGMSKPIRQQARVVRVDFESLWKVAALLDDPRFVTSDTVVLKQLNNVPVN